jgi:DNA-binding transcriptional LysR family regulator
MSPPDAAPKRNETGLRRRVRLRQLELLAAMEHAPTLGRAARDVHLSQPAASKLLNTLATDLGVDLFQRRGRTLSPTAAGQALIRRASSLIGNLDQAQAELEAMRDGRIGSATIGAGTGACYVLVPSALALLLANAPDIAVAIREGPMRDLFAMLREGRLDMVVGRVDTTLIDRDLVLDDLYDPPMSIVAGPRHPLGQARQVSWPMLLDQEWILPEPGTPMRMGIESAFRRTGFRPRRCLVESSAVQANVALLGKRNMLWVLSSDIAAYFVAQGNMRILPVPKLQGAGPLAVVRLRDRMLSPAAARLIECVVAAAQRIPSSYKTRARKS